MLVDQLHAGKLIRKSIGVWPQDSLTIISLEYSNIRVFNVHPGMAKSPVLRKELEVYAKDTRKLATRPVGNPRVTD